MEKQELVHESLGEREGRRIVAFPTRGFAEKDLQLREEGGWGLGGRYLPSPAPPGKDTEIPEGLLKGQGKRGGNPKGYFIYSG